MSEKRLLCKRRLAKTRREYANFSANEMWEQELEVVPKLCAKAYKREKFADYFFTIGYSISLGAMSYMVGMFGPTEIGQMIDSRTSNDECFASIDFTDLGFGVHNVLRYAGVVGALSFSIYGICKQTQANKLQRQNECFSDLLAEKQNNQNANQNKNLTNEGNALANKIKKHYYDKEMLKIRDKFKNYSAEEMAGLEEKFIDDNLRKVFKYEASVHKATRRAIVSTAIAVGYNLGCTDGYKTFYGFLYGHPDDIRQSAYMFLGLGAICVLEPFKIAGLCTDFSARKFRRKAEAYEDVMQEKSVQAKESEEILFRHR